MGCGSSHDDGIDLRSSGSAARQSNNSNGSNIKQITAYNNHKNESDIVSINRDGEEINCTALDATGNNSRKHTAARSIAFDVTLDGRQAEILLAKHPPRRLQMLEPLPVPRLSAEELAEKQKLAEEKREIMKHKKSELSKKKSMRIEHAKMAREYEMQKQLLQEQGLEAAETNKDEPHAFSDDFHQEDKVDLEEECDLTVTPIKSIDDNILKTAVNDFERDDTYNISGSGSWLAEDDSNFMMAATSHVSNSSNQVIEYESHQDGYSSFPQQFTTLATKSHQDDDFFR